MEHSVHQTAQCRTVPLSRFQQTPQGYSNDFDDGTRVPFDVPRLRTVKCQEMPKIRDRKTNEPNTKVQIPVVRFPFANETNETF